MSNQLHVCCITSITHPEHARSQNDRMRTIMISGRSLDDHLAKRLNVRMGTEKDCSRRFVERLNKLSIRMIVYFRVVISLAVHMKYILPKRFCVLFNDTILFISLLPTKQILQNTNCLQRSIYHRLRLSTMLSVILNSPDLRHVNDDSKIKAGTHYPYVRTARTYGQCVPTPVRTGRTYGPYGKKHCMQCFFCPYGPYVRVVCTGRPFMSLVMLYPFN